MDCFSSFGISDKTTVTNFIHWSRALEEGYLDQWANIGKVLANFKNKAKQKTFWCIILNSSGSWEQLLTNSLLDECFAKCLNVCWVENWEMASYVMNLHVFLGLCPSGGYLSFFPVNCFLFFDHFLLLLFFHLSVPKTLYKGD